MTIYKSIKKTIMSKLTIKFILCWIYTIVVPMSTIYIYIQLLINKINVSLSIQILSFIILIAIISSSMAMSMLLKIRLIPKVKLEFRIFVGLGICTEDDIMIVLPFTIITLTPKKFKL